MPDDDAYRHPLPLKTERNYVLLPDRVLRPLLQLLIELEEIAAAVGRQIDGHWSEGAERLRGCIAGLKAPTKEEALIRAQCAADEEPYRERKRQEQLEAERRADERWIRTLEADSKFWRARERALNEAKAIAKRLAPRKRKPMVAVRTVKPRRA